MLRGVRLHLIVLLILLDRSFRVKHFDIGFLGTAWFTILATSPLSLVVALLCFNIIFIFHHFRRLYDLLTGNKDIVWRSFETPWFARGSFSTTLTPLVGDANHLISDFDLRIVLKVLSVDFIGVNHGSIIFSSDAPTLANSCSITWYLRVDGCLHSNVISPMLNSALVLWFSIFTISDSLKIKFLFIVINIFINYWTAVCKLLNITAHVPWATLFIFFVIIVSWCLHISSSLDNPLSLVSSSPADSTFSSPIRLNSASPPGAFAILGPWFILNNNLLIN